MVTNWFDETTKELREGDRMQKSYRIELNGHMGYLTLTNERIIFISTNGFFKKTYKKKLDLQYDEIKEIYDKGNRTFDLIGINDQKYSFSTLNIPASVIENSINYFREYSPPLEKTSAQEFAANPYKGDV
jgi:hypothetical protein